MISALIHANITIFTQINPIDMELTYTERLSRYIIILISTAIIAFVCWYLRSVLFYLLLALAMSLLAHPFYKLFSRIHIKKYKCPSWLAALCAILTVFLGIMAALTTVAPVVRNVTHDISMANINNMAQAASVPLSSLNQWIMNTFPNVGSDFKIESVVIQELQKAFTMGSVSNVLGSVTSFFASLGVTLFAVIFISFYFIKTPHLFSTILIAMLPEKYEKKVHSSLNEIGRLVSRYFVGLTIEVLGVSLLNFLGLLLVARMGFRYSIGIACLTGFLNIIPYIGPLIGGAIGVSLSLIIRYVCTTSFGIAVGFVPFVLILIGIFFFTQLVDNYFFQPVIYSNSIKVHPLEIFIVFLVAGQVGGMLGMLAAIPAYTVLRVIAKQFLSNVKAIRILTMSK